MPTSVPPKGDEFRRANAHFANLKVYAQDAPDLTVKVSAGGYWIDEKTYVEFSGGSTSALTPPPGSAKWVLILLTDLGSLETLDGAQASSPTLPDLPADRLPLAGIFLSATDIEITSTMVFDMRPLWKAGARVSDVLISDVTGLQSALDDKASVATLNSSLSSKADVDGTIESDFILNKDQTGVPGADVRLIVERGSAPNVDIRWNESTEIWEFTNDGSIWLGLGSTEINASTQAQINSNTSGVATNASAIGTLFAVGGSASASAIAQNQTDILANASAIVVTGTIVSANASAIGTLQTDVLGIATNASAIGTLQTDVGANDTDILNLQTDLFKKDGSVPATGTFQMADNIIQAPELKDYSESMSSPAIAAGVLTIDLSLGNMVDVTMDQSIGTLTINNIAASGLAGSFTMIMTQDITGSRTITWPVSVKWSNGLAPILITASNAVNILTFLTVDGGTTWYGFVAGEAMS